MKITYKATFDSGRLIIRVYVDGVFRDEIAMPSLPVFTHAVTTQALWKQFFQSISEEN